MAHHFAKAQASRLRHSTAVSLLMPLVLGALPAPAMAADGDQPPPPPATKPLLEARDTHDIVVTGSRIRRDNFNTPSPVEIYSRDVNFDSGARSLTDVLQSASITSGTSQINGAFLGFVSQGGAAAETVGLRGLGASRTLVLINGRRLAPAGVGPELVSADLNVLPDAVVSNIEILREGASSVYGSDAIAGVINIITDKKMNGLTADFYTDRPLDTGGAGGTIRASVTAGKNFERGHIMASFEYGQEDGLRASDRPEFSCPRDLLYSPATGAEVGATDPATGKLSCFPYALGSGAGIASGYGIGVNYTTGSAGRYTYDNGNIDTLRAVNGLTRVSPSPTQLLDTVISPKKTYTAYLNGSYELEVLGDAEVYGEALFTRRQSWQDSATQLSINFSQLDPSKIQIYGGSYNGTPLSAYGYPTSPFFPNSLATKGINQFTPFIVYDHPQRSSQTVDFLRANGGLRGNLGLGDWHYDANFQYSRTWGAEYQQQILQSRLTNALQAVLAPAGTPASAITYAVAGQAGAGGAYTCASNLDGGGAFIPGSTCVPLNMYDPAVMIGGHVPQNVLDYLYAENDDHTQYLETIATLNADGSLFELPGGTAKMALGYEHRHEALTDTPSIYAQNAELYNYSSAGITTGADDIDEVYGEVNLPFLKDRQLVKKLELNLSGRWTHYKSYGSDFTYHLNGDWAPTSFLQFRGNFGTSFRAPNLYELYLANQTGFYGSGVDPCSGFATAYAPTDNVYKNCLAQLTPILGSAGALNYFANSGPEVTTKGGLGNLKAEHSRAWGLGVVLTPPVPHGDLSIAVDYWNITVNEEVQQLGNLILNRCYESSDFSNDPYCKLIQPRYAAGTPFAGDLVSFDNPYLNVSVQKASGVDFDVKYRTALGGGRLDLRLQATRNIHQYYQLFATDPVTDYNGTLGQQGVQGGPKWVGDLDVNYRFRGDHVRLHWGIKYVGSQDSTDAVGAYVASLGLGQVNTIFKVGAYFEHNASIEFRINDDDKLIIGCDNCTDSHPPIVSQIPATDGEITRIGNYFNSSNYDYYGRSLFMRVTHKFL